MSLKNTHNPKTLKDSSSWSKIKKDSKTSASRLTRHRDKQKLKKSIDKANVED